MLVQPDRYLDHLFAVFILLGQTGMLSFGHAVYYGLGGFLAMHGMKLIAGSKLPVSLPLVPLIGGKAGLFFAAVLGWVPTRRSGTAFAMISLGVAELVASSSLKQRKSALFCSRPNPGSMILRASKVSGLVMPQHRRRGRSPIQV